MGNMEIVKTKPEEANDAVAAYGNADPVHRGASVSTAFNVASLNEDVRPKLWTGVFMLIIFITFVCFVIGQGLNAGTSVYLSHRGYGESLSGVLTLVFSAAAAIMRLTVGPLIDRGRCSLVIIAGIAVLTAGAFIPVALDGVEALVVSRILQGIGFAMSTTAAATAAAEVLPAKRLGEGIGYHGLGQAIAMAIGPAFALYLVGTDPAFNLYLGLTLAGIVGLIAAFFVRYEHRPKVLPETSAFRMRYERKQESERAREERSEALDASPDAPDGVAASVAKQGGLSSLFEPRALAGALPVMVISPTFGFGIFFVGLYGTELGVGSASLFYTIAAVSMIVVRLKSGAFMDRVVPIKIFTVAVICGLVTTAMLFFAAVSDWIFYLSGISYGLCLGLAMPVNQSVAVKNTPSDRWGAANGLFLLAQDLGIGLSSVLWGVTAEQFGFQVTIVLVACCIAASYAIAWASYPKRDKAWK